MEGLYWMCARSGPKLASFTSGLHHHTTTDGIEGVGGETGDSGHTLGDHPAYKNASVLGIWQHTWGEEKALF